MPRRILSGSLATSRCPLRDEPEDEEEEEEDVRKEEDDDDDDEGDGYSE
jgi:hypothetical protein